MYGLADCNNFFVSCERAFQPQLEGRPVVVLSNNDGCIVARSNEAKAMGIKMGTPFFQVRALVEEGRLEVRSSNYTLYGDLSRRVMRMLRAAVPHIEVYSIDEAFLHLEDLPEAERRAVCVRLVRDIRRGTGIPVSIGIAPSKTLAKVANHFAKRYPGYRGVCSIDSDEKRLKALELTPIDDVWGIGWRGAPKLAAAGVATALDFVQRPEEWVRSKMGVGGVRTWMELQGRPVIAEEEEERRQSICTSRSFAELITDRDTLASMVSDFAALTARKLRKDGSAAAVVGIFLGTNRFRDDLPQYSPYEHEVLPVPTDSTQELVRAALSALDRCWRPGYGYKRAGVIVERTVPADEVQGSLFDADPEDRQRNRTVSAMMDRFNGEDGDMLRLGMQNTGLYSAGIRREHCSPLYTSDWNSLLEVR